MSDSADITTQLILILFLTLINAFFAAAEMSIVSVNRLKIKSLSEEGNSSAKLLEILIEEPSNFLSTIQIGITLAGFFSSASAATGVANYLSNILLPFNIPYCSEFSMIIVTLILSYLTLVLGELVPKRIALQQSERIALFTVKPIYIISKFTKPFIKLLSFSTSIVLQILGVEDDDIELKISKEEIKSLISKCQEDGFIDTCEQDMINSVFEFKSKSIREIMTPRNNMFAIDIEEDNEKIIDQVLNSPFSRIPVYKDTNDNIIGILYIKDVFIEARKVGFDKVDIESILQQPNFVLETIKTNELFNMLKTKKVHLAILFDEYGSISGLVSMEDLIEEIVGDIEDEYDPEANTIKKLDNDKFIVKGYLSVSEFNNKFNVLLDEGDYDTLNGYILNQLGTLPEEGTIIETNDIRFKVITVNNRRIEDIEITNINKE